MVRNEISMKNKYWIPKHRFLELKHFCLQYKDWKRMYRYLSDKTDDYIYEKEQIEWSDPTGKGAVSRAECRKYMDMVETAAERADPTLKDYILKSVTEGASFTKLKTLYKIPCGKDMFFDRYRYFFWILNTLKTRT